MAVCLSAGALSIVIPASTFVLSWTHSVERTVWEERWRAVGDTLVLDAASVQGSGAGMEPGAAARLVDGAWHYRPTLPPQRHLRLAHSEFAGDYRLCWRENCRRLADLIAHGDETGEETLSIEIRPCPARERALESGFGDDGLAGGEAPQPVARATFAKEDER